MAMAESPPVLPPLPPPKSPLPSSSSLSRRASQSSRGSVVTDGDEEKPPPLPTSSHRRSREGSLLASLNPALTVLPYTSTASVGLRASAQRLRHGSADLTPAQVRARREMPSPPRTNKGGSDGASSIVDSRPNVITPVSSEKLIEVTSRHSRSSSVSQSPAVSGLPSLTSDFRHSRASSSPSGSSNPSITSTPSKRSVPSSLTSSPSRPPARRPPPALTNGDSDAGEADETVEHHQLASPVDLIGTNAESRLKRRSNQPPTFKDRNQRVV